MSPGLHVWPASTRSCSSRCTCTTQISDNTARAHDNEPGEAREVKAFPVVSGINLELGGQVDEAVLRDGLVPSTSRHARTRSRNKENEAAALTLNCRAGYPTMPA